MMYPNRVLLGTETFPADIVRLWKIVKENPHVIGNMTWTGLDYFQAPEAKNSWSNKKSWMQRMLKKYI